MSNHLTPRQMLAYIDGELSRVETRRVSKHLHSCWTCLAELERLKGDITIILDAQNEAFTPAISTPPRPWPGFETILSRNLPEKRLPLSSRFFAHLEMFLNPVRILMASGVLAALLVGAYSILHVRSVSAKEVLRKIEVADKQRRAITKQQVIRERVRIRKTTHRQSRSKLTSVDTWKSPTAAYWNIEDTDSAAADLKALYQVNDIPMDLPLSAVSVNAWGKAVGGEPTVSQQGEDLDLNFTGSSKDATRSIERINILIQPDTWYVKQMTLDFQDASFEVTEDGYSIVPASEVPIALLAYLEPDASPPALGVSTTRPVSDIASSAIHLPVVNLNKAALDVFTILHSLKADLGEPIVVTRTNQAIHVGLWQLSSSRQSELRTALSGKAGIQVDLAAPRIHQEKKVMVGTNDPSVSSNTPSQMQVASGDDDQRLTKYFGNQQKEQAFTNEALGVSTAILSHLYALRNLQGQFPLSRIRLLLPDEQQQLQALVQDHVTIVAANLDALTKQMGPLASNFGASSCTSGGATTPNWQSGSTEALETARKIDHLLRALLTTSQSPASPDVALPEINQNICLLQGELAGLQEQSIH